MPGAAGVRLALVACAFLLAACAPVGRPISALASAPVELAATPFFPQKRYQCGPAALGIVLAASGREVPVADLVAQVYLPGRRGSLQAELLSAAREHDRLPYVLRPDQGALAAELLAGRPVLVLQNLGTGPFPRWHYAVVIGMDPARDVYILRSGTDRRRLTPRSVFMRTWARGDYWAMSVLAPGALPGADDADGYLRALAAAESAGAPELAESGYHAALTRWPDSRLARLGLGNIALGRGELGEAEAQYRLLLVADPADLVVMNNLAETLARGGRTGEARELIADAIAIAGPEHPLSPTLRATRDGLDAGADGTAQD